MFVTMVAQYQPVVYIAGNFILRVIADVIGPALFSYDRCHQLVPLSAVHVPRSDQGESPTRPLGRVGGDDHASHGSLGSPYRATS